MIELQRPGTEKALGDDVLLICNLWGRHADKKRTFQPIGRAALEPFASKILSARRVSNTPDGTKRRHDHEFDNWEIQ